MFFGELVFVAGNSYLILDQNDFGVRSTITGTYHTIINPIRNTFW